MNALESWSAVLIFTVNWHSMRISLECFFQLRHSGFVPPILNHFPLLERVASFGLPVILSTGVSRLGDIERAISCL